MEDLKASDSSKQLNKNFNLSNKDKTALSSYSLPRKKKSISTNIVTEAIKVVNTPINDEDGSKLQDSNSNDIKGINVDTHYLSSPAINEVFLNDNEIINLKWKISDKDSNNNIEEIEELRKNSKM